MDKPFFSVILPLYNASAFLPRPLETLCAQTYGNWECVCVDDGSCDDTGNILDAWMQKDKRFRVLHVENKGVSQARNIGMSVAKGKYLVFLDSDDVYVPNALEYLVEAIDRNGMPDAFTYGSVSVEMHSDYGLPNYALACEKVFNLCTSDGLRSAFKAKFGDLVAWNACLRRDAIQGIKFEDMPNGEDILWGMHCMMVAKNMCCSSAAIYRYLQRPESAMHTISEKHARSAILCVRRMAESAAQWDRKTEVSDILFRRILGQVLGYVRIVLLKLPLEKRRKLRGDFVDALKFLCRDSGLLTRWKRAYFCVAVSNPMTRLLMLYVPFGLYKFGAKIGVRRLFQSVK